MPSSSVNNIVGPDSSNFNPTFGSFCGRGGRNGRGRGRGGRFFNVQCQVCFKFEHLASTFFFEQDLASTCWYRFNHQFQAPIPSNFQGFMPTSSDSYHHAFNSRMSSYGVTLVGYNPLQHLTRPPPQRRQPSLQFTRPSARITNAQSTSGSFN